MFNFGLPELLVILVLALLLFGPGKLPEVGRWIGRGVRDFRRGMREEPRGEQQDKSPEEKAAEQKPPEEE